MGSWRATKGLGGDPAPYVVLHEMTGSTPMLGILGRVVCLVLASVAARAAGEQVAITSATRQAARVRRTAQA